MAAGETEIMTYSETSSARKPPSNCISTTLKGIVHLISEPVNLPRKRTARIAVTDDVCYKSPDELYRSESNASTNVSVNSSESEGDLFMISPQMQQAVDAACSCNVISCCRS